MRLLIVFCFVLSLCVLATPRAWACSTVPGLSPLLRFSDDLQTGKPMGLGAVALAARQLAQQDPAELPRMLRRAGHGDQTGALLAFFGSLQLVMERAIVGDTQGAQALSRTEAFSRAHAGARQAKTVVCEGLEGVPVRPKAPGGTINRIGSDGRGSETVGARSPYETPLALYAQRFVMTFLGIMSLLVIVHYGLVWHHSAKRRRRIVSIPAMTQLPEVNLPGRVTILEIQGAKFVTEQPLAKDLPDDTELTLSIGSAKFTVSVISSGQVAHHFSFKEKLTPEQHSELLSASMIPPRRDPMARDVGGTRTATYRYGRGHLQERSVSEARSV